MFDGFTEKQKSFVRDVIIGDTKRINILEGSVRSGKTYVSLIAWLILLAQMPTENNYLMVGKTLTSLKRNCLSILDSIVPPKFFKYSLIKKEASIFDHKIFLEGVNDSRSEHKIRGMTLQAAYCDEITLYPEDFFTMLLSRLSQTGSKLLGTTNPDSPMHWFYQKFLTRQSEISLKTWKFLLDDNTTIETQIRNDIKKEYTGVFYERFVLGRWVQADGIIYDQFANEPEKYIINDIKISQLDSINIGIDYGASKSNTALVAVGFCNKFESICVLDEMQIEGVQSPEQLYKYIEQFVRKVFSKFGDINNILADWGGLGQVLTKGLRYYLYRYVGQFQVSDCKKIKIIDRIQLLSRLMSFQRFKIMNTCTNTIEALRNAVWDSSAIDTRLDDGSVNIDMIDAMEYAFIPHASILNSKLNIIPKLKRMNII